MPVVWVLRGAADAGVVVPTEFVSICNNKGPFGLVTVTDRDRRLAAAKRSQSVTSNGQNSTQLLQIETKVGRSAEKSRSVTFGRLKTVYLLQIETFPGCRWGGTAMHSVLRISSFLR